MFKLKEQVEHMKCNISEISIVEEILYITLDKFMKSWSFLELPKRFFPNILDQLNFSWHPAVSSGLWTNFTSHGILSLNDKGYGKHTSSSSS